MLGIARTIRRRRDTVADDAGFTLMEVIVSVALFAIMATMTGLALTGNVKSSRLTNERVKASNLAQSLLASFKPGKELPASFPNIGPEGYVVRIATSPATPTCTVGTTRQVSIVIYPPHSSGTGTPLARTDSVVSC